MASVRGLSSVASDALKELNLTGNTLTALEAEFLNFPRLKRLYAASNAIAAVGLPPLEHLDTLNLSDNKARPLARRCPVPATQHSTDGVGGALRS